MQEETVVMYLEPACRGLLAAVFLVAGFGKARSRAAFTAFADSLDAVSLLPKALRGVAPAALVAVEAVTATLLVTPVTAAAVAGFALAVGMLTAFVIVISVALRRGERISCLCFGSDAGPMDRSHVVRNAVLAGVALVGLLSSLIASADGSPAGVIAAAGAGVLAGALITRWDDLRYLLAHS